MYPPPYTITTRAHQRQYPRPSETVPEAIRDRGHQRPRTGIRGPGRASETQGRASETQGRATETQGRAMYGQRARAMYGREHGPCTARGYGPCTALGTPVLPSVQLAVRCYP